jgi:flagellar biosynthesis chaperone FliJ
MKIFSFRLERVLQLRKDAEQTQARRVAGARQDEAERRLQAEASATLVAEAIDQLSAIPGDLRTAGTIGNLMLTLEAARARAHASAGLHRDAVARLEVEMLTFEQARQARRAIEKLREQRFDSWERDTIRAEQIALDEVALRVPRVQWATG